MKVRNFALCAALAAALGTTACGHNPSNQEIGTAGGAVVGGVLGNAATGSTRGTVGGAAVGGVIGNEVGKRRDAR
jgi:osmotically inducible lipoprotein OsmB